MFKHANNILPATTTLTDLSHALCVRLGGQLHRMYGFKNYDAALAAYMAADAASDCEFAVRSTFDPNVQVGILSDRQMQDIFPSHAVGRALRAWQRQEIAATVKWAIDRAVVFADNGIESTWASIYKTAKDSLDAREFEYERWDIEDEMKKRLRIARPVNGARRGYCWKSSTRARVYDVRGRDGEALKQTSLALDAPFYFIADPVSTFFATGLKPLPGEKDEDVYKRLDRVHEAIDAENGTLGRRPA